jgi:hypothetical protein
MEKHLVLHLRPLLEGLDLNLSFVLLIGEEPEAIDLRITIGGGAVGIDVQFLFVIGLLDERVAGTESNMLEVEAGSSSLVTK